MRQRRRHVVAALLIVMALTGCSRQSAPNTTPPPTTATPSSATTIAMPTSQQSAGFTLPDYAGKTLDVAVAELLKNGVLYDAEDAVNGKMVLSPKNWTVTSSSPVPGTVVKAGEKVVLQVHKPQDTKAADPPAEVTTTTGLDAVFAQAACDIYGKREYRFGWDPHWILDAQPAQLVNDRWVLKVGADVTNQYNAKAKVTVECTVGGTKDQPVVESFLAY